MRKAAWLAGFLFVAPYATAQDGGLNIANWPQTYYCSVGNWPQTQQVSVTGSVQIGNFPTSQPVTGTFWPTVQPVSGTFWQAPATSATVSRVTIGPTVVTLAPANSARRKLVVFNEAGTLRVKLGPNASLTDYTYELLASAGNNRQDIDGYSGIVTGIKVSGSSAAQVTEF